jgi:hypothetical protein
MNQATDAYVSSYLPLLLWVCETYTEEFERERELAAGAVMMRRVEEPLLVLGRYPD